MYIAIAGNIGSGKSTLTAMLAERYRLHPVYEAVEENPYLEDFYRDMRAWAFHSQVFFLARRLEQHLKEINGRKRVVQDRTIFEDAFIFAKNLHRQGYLSERDWRTYLALYEGIAPALRMPDRLVYIRASLPTLRARIAKRGRTYERAIPDAYLQALNELYEEWVANYTLSPVLIVPGDELDFVEDAGARQWVYDALEAGGLTPPLTTEP
ncbi:deoxynucleoside kinase [Marinithermus hydrothermalis]|uniref:Deoxyadenosine kinase n=1 Tax=Marinithermus hydrothermalis (strain DSM 14884 / JCM 11576 / T1) TaxID=869210 RepID=F2NM39_MARHT|nr:deoxynucleoside kinase [Marinithermus hydrothermalis]AEB11509.1 Deoxyadenosine kinase [Marinithermus hydrothermalis DSM 14884]